jgi:hypothetical protein
VEHDLVHHVVVLVDSLLVRELGDVVRCLGVVGGELLVDNFVLLLLGQVLLVRLLVGLHVEKLVVVLQVL